MIGTVAFAASGALVGIHKGMDVFGVCILGLTTACGGGMVRDVLLGNTPPAAFQDPVPSAVAVATSLILFLSGVRHLLMGNQRRYDLFMLLMDSAGLGIFTVMGVRTAWHCVEEPPLYLLVFVGAVTGVGRRTAAGHHGPGHALYFHQAYLRLRVPGGGAAVRADAACGGDAGHGGRGGAGVCDPVPVRPLPVESAENLRLKGKC